MRNEKGITGRQPSGNRSFLHRYRRRGQNGVGQGVYGAEQRFEGAELQLYLRRGGKAHRNAGRRPEPCLRLRRFRPSDRRNLLGPDQKLCLPDGQRQNLRSGQHPFLYQSKRHKSFVPVLHLRRRRKYSDRFQERHGV